MNEVRAATNPAMRTNPAPAMNLARVGRLALKELRETLRDRRTIITLLIMPILVYPILSLAFHQFLVTSFERPNKVQLHIAAENQEELRTLVLLLNQGHEYLKERDSSASNSPLTGGPILGADLGAKELPPSEQDFFVVRDDLPASLEDLIRNNEIDLGVRLLPQDGNDVQAAARFQLVYRPNTPLSRQAANYVEKRLEAANELNWQQRLAAAGDREPQRVAWRLRPVADEQGHSFWLGTLVPLVLILMTITGAVYPAIDLTAGERERNTLESLMAAPVPRLAVLMAKYVAVVTVAMLTAIVNLTAMTVTISSTPNLGPLLFGTSGLTPQSMLAVLLLLVLFAAFFSAVLLLITSFARSFKEAQAYLIPLMVASLAPGFMSVMPGLALNGPLSVVPLANIVLLARDVLEGDAPWLWGLVAVLSTVLYGGLALALAARVFGSDAILYGSEGSWGDLFRRPATPRTQATISGALAALAVVLPVYIVASGLLAQLQSTPIPSQLLAMAGTSLILFVVLPLVMARWQGVNVGAGFQLARPGAVSLIAAAALGLTLWPLAYDLIILCQQFGIATLSKEKLAESRPLLMQYVERLRGVSPALVLGALAVCPAIGEEFFFRGYLLRALRGRMPAAGAIAITSIVFGLFHAGVGGLIAVERVLSSTFLGAVLGWVCWQTRSVWPGIVVHVLHNGFMLSLIYFAPRLQAWGWDVENERYLPVGLVVGATVVAGVALWLMTFCRLGRNEQPVQSEAPNTHLASTEPR